MVYLLYVDYVLELLKGSQILQAAISNMDGVGGKPAWSWIFSSSHPFFARSLAGKPNIIVVIEGLATFLAGAASFWIVQDFPDTAKFLTEAERTVVIRRLQVDNQFSAAGESFKMRYIFKSVVDWKTWVASGSLVTILGLVLITEKLREIVICYAGSDMPLYAFSLFLPSIISQVCLGSCTFMSRFDSKFPAWWYEHPC